MNEDILFTHKDDLKFFIFFFLHSLCSYSQCIPSRFKKEIVLAAVKQSETADRIVLDGLHRVIANIGVEHKISRDELQTIFAEIGEHDGAIPKDRMLTMI
jgi:hypothetical protein